MLIKLSTRYIRPHIDKDTTTIRISISISIRICMRNAVPAGAMQFPQAQCSSRRRDGFFRGRDGTAAGATALPRHCRGRDGIVASLPLARRHCRGSTLSLVHYIYKANAYHHVVDPVMSLTL